jgi:NAD(P)-dependent dehydrogenase (short-subunit alcohol dehydrogenase family)
MERSSGLLARRKALVTGGETGIGVAIARALAWRGGLHD